MAVTRAPASSDEDGDEHQSQEPQEPQQPPPAHPPHALHQHSLSDASTVTIDVGSWASNVLGSMNVAPAARGTGNVIAIPLDGDRNGSGYPDNGADRHVRLRRVAFSRSADDAYGASIAPPRQPPSRRDSLRRRDALLKGKEGTRQRRRYENDRLMHVPNVQPPSPSDWQISPTYPVLEPVQYQLAHHWDRGLRERVEAEHQRRIQTPDPGAHVVRALRAAAKRVPALRTWLRMLEEPVRRFVVECGLAAAAACPTEDAAKADGDPCGDSSDETGTEDDEIVSVARNGRMRDGKPRKEAQRQVAGQDQEMGMVLEEMDDGAGGAFKRWLTHSISDYYGLDSKSVMVGTPARRVIYVGVKQKQPGPRHKRGTPPALPPALCEMF